MYIDPYNNENYRNCMPMMNMPMYGYYTPEFDDEDLESLYPKFYMRTYPMVKEHCDIIEYRYGAMYSPSKEELDYTCKQICDKYEEYFKDDDDDGDDDVMERQGYGRRRRNEDFIKALLIRDLLGRRRRIRRRRRRRPHLGYNYYGYWY